MNDDGNRYLFVYGTLMRGHENPFSQTLRAGSEFVGKGHFTGKLYRVDWYPGALYLPDEQSLVWGEVYRLFDFEKLIPELDEYEDVLVDEAASLYLRREVPVNLTDGQQLVCWTYLYNQPIGHLPVIEGGKFH
ncbi:gamma-glutamylcyclotransferase family protein [Persicitalea jodogahamensis]|uniref:Gamma-glutamylcyclotransferase n=1 Tax=Persicitalea jodogahamensis TaxID=402147 RepID=A0A8J3D9D4_9BACT|nr:gamma-glutamylcyclotransferase family protein [Persicitalea jodogahamensis]GHB69762.1 gamma-glutamylcyclotransferase [Persicitalea jodogahamensis]